MGDDEDKGGIVLGGISFGDGMPSKPDERKKGEASATEGAQEIRTRGPAERPAALGDAMLPLRVVVVADLMPSDDHNAGANPPEQATRIEVGHFDELFKRLAPRLAIEVESVLLDGGMARIDLSPVAIKSFRPDGLVREVPLLRSLLDGKRVLERLRDGSTDIDAASGELNRLWNGSSLVSKVLGGVEVKQASTAQPAAPEPSATTDTDVARILDMVDGGTKADDAAVAAGPAPTPAAAPAGTGKGRFDAFIAAVAKSGKGQEGARPDEGIRTIEKALSLQLGAILQHPEVRRLEEAWRGVAFLAGRTPKDAVLVEVVSARPDDMATALDRAIGANAGIEPPVSFAVVDTVVGGDASSLARWRQLADICEAHTVPFITNTSASLLGKSHLEGVDRLDNKQGLFDPPEQAPWRAEASRPATLWSALALNRVLARKPYDKRTSRIREATVEELPADETATVWMQPCWAVASLILRSFGKTGWPCNITGARDSGIIEDLPVQELAL
ncbi:MAG: type VI secretion system contractile sheath large subunit, partial [Deltaproteobacteria bacterium]|nr:type VI secretion system contractile sheath large subunit [Deltaproteobacteria bacterium]